jgi:hypothetical protein
MMVLWWQMVGTSRNNLVPTRLAPVYSREGRRRRGLPNLIELIARGLRQVLRIFVVGHLPPLYRNEKRARNILIRADVGA